jgi:hypothetical protein
MQHYNAFHTIKTVHIRCFQRKTKPMELYNKDGQTEAYWDLEGPRNTHQNKS